MPKPSDIPFEYQPLPMLLRSAATVLDMAPKICDVTWHSLAQALFDRADKVQAEMDAEMEAGRANR